MRLQKYMARCGIASRRKCEEIIMQNRVKVNESIINELGAKIDPDNDIIEVDNTIIKIENQNIYIVLNKPVGYVTTVSDEFQRPTVIDLVADIEQRIYPVGRLDYDTSGLLLLTNDGNLTYKFTHPSHEIIKTYIAKIKGKPSLQALENFRNGLKIDGYITAKASIKILKSFTNSSIVEIKIHEGKNRQIRKMCEKIGNPVIDLKRTAMGIIQLGSLKEGKWRYLSDRELKYLKKNQL